MRRWFVVLLIVLLPWRAWAGDAMVLSMAGAPEQVQVAAVAGTATAPHCADHAVADPATPGEPSLHAACDICNGPLLATTSWSAAGPEPLPPSRLTAGVVRFASALPRLGHKPPIS